MPTVCGSIISSDLLFNKSIIIIKLEPFIRRLKKLCCFSTKKFKFSILKRPIFLKFTWVNILIPWVKMCQSRRRTHDNWKKQNNFRNSFFGQYYFLDNEAFRHYLLASLTFKFKLNQPTSFMTKQVNDRTDLSFSESRYRTMQVSCAADLYR